MCPSENSPQATAPLRLLRQHRADRAERVLQLKRREQQARSLSIEQTRAAVELAQVQSRHRLAILLGQRPGALDALRQPREMPAFAKALPLGDSTGLLRRRADVRAVERRLAAATARGRAWPLPTCFRACR